MPFYASLESRVGYGGVGIRIGMGGLLLLKVRVTVTVILWFKVMVEVTAMEMKVFARSS